ncbi:Uncharacterised protein [Vibrio cholerae]|uniref:Uncharacterized protein n=1 Tax=Vibrio cholerae TaxID=666 RepID=A0A656APK0_VIBCL|nr:Uncharacterised protein [Vibrio cholerae]CSI70945.1 Uncharacterised protein [Vibrio cholerae]
MLRCAKHFGSRTELHQITTVHHRYAISNVRNHTHIVSNQHATHIILLTQFANQIQDLVLNRHIQRGGRFIGDDQIRFTSQRDRNHHPLTHATRELVRILFKAIFRLRNTDLLHQR